MSDVTRSPGIMKSSPSPPQARKPRDAYLLFGERPTLSEVARPRSAVVVKIYAARDVLIIIRCHLQTTIAPTEDNIQLQSLMENEYMIAVAAATDSESLHEVVDRYLSQIFPRVLVHLEVDTKIIEHKLILARRRRAIPEHLRGYQARLIGPVLNL